MSTQPGERGRAARQKLAAMTPNAAAMHARSADLLPVEVVPTFVMPSPLYIHSARNGEVIDVDGNTYIDLTMGAGPNVLCHRQKVVEDATRDQLDQAWRLVLQNDRRLELTELIREAVPIAEKTVFCNSGTEATMYAMRTARAHSGKARVAVFDGCYHGARAQLASPNLRDVTEQSALNIVPLAGTGREIGGVDS